MRPRNTPARGNEQGEAQDLAPSGELLRWYDRHARVLAWRVRAPARPDPYRVWLAEIMLQQTTVAAVGPYFQRFVERWPTVGHLAEAAPEDVLAAWAGLGYYSRARNLHRCARQIVETHGGRFPESEAELLKLPGIGPYTAAAIAAIAFDRPAVVVDGNVERVIARMFAIATPLPAAKAAIREAAAALAPAVRPGDYAQALMDLGATICVPRQPRCMLCPWAHRCAARRRGEPERFPAKAGRKARPRRAGIAFVVTRPDGAVWLRRRAEKGLLGGMLGVPTTEWTAPGPSDADALRAAPVRARWRKLAGGVEHGFTHFDLSLRVWVARLAPSRWPALAGGRWVAPDGLETAGLPTVMRKIVSFATTYRN